MKVRFKQPWQSFQRGDVADLEGDAYRHVLDNHIAERCGNAAKVTPRRKVVRAVVTPQRTNGKAR